MYMHLSLFLPLLNIIFVSLTFLSTIPACGIPISLQTSQKFHELSWNLYLFPMRCSNRSLHIEYCTGVCRRAWLLSLHHFMLKVQFEGMRRETAHITLALYRMTVPALMLNVTPGAVLKHLVLLK